ncbi:sensor histidine kinase [Desulfurispora thermophila]|uniref:sensor histidine kinase n=1 Tax=Desulfurispora thermophila TaxID=265470 RepID=UPI000366732F|nr:ATP-binding protein [Desulfurispora thermophila]
MNFFQRSITAKLWLAMVLLVLITLGTIGLVHNYTMQQGYVQQQYRQLQETGRRAAALLADSARQDQSGLASALNQLATISHTNITLISARGGIQQCQGLGMGMGAGMGGMHGGRGNGGPWWLKQTEGGAGGRMSALPDGIGSKLGRVFQGETVYYRGHNELLGADVLAVLLPVKLPGDTPGAIIVSALLSDISGQLNYLRQNILLSALAGIVLATLLSLLFSRTLSRPLLAMQKAARRLAAGDFGCRVPVQSQDELGGLGQALNSLAEQLAEKVSHLEQLNQTRRDFVAAVAHELRTPLTVIRGYAEALQDGLAENPAEARAFLQNIIDESSRLERMARELLDLRRLETGHERVDTKPLDLGPLLDDVLEKARPLWQEKELSVQKNIPGDLPPALAHADRLTQVLLNLLNNAIRHSPRGSKLIVAAEHRPASGTLCLSVSDSGPGIPPDELPLIWEKFYKIEKSRARENAGTGLGLAIVKTFVESMGGRVEAESTPGKGSTFQVFLPAASK